MAHEIEVKILEVDRERLEDKLKSMGARKVFDGEISALYFDFEDKSIRKANDIMRLRKAGNKTFLTFKGFLHNKGAKVREELEVEVADFEIAKRILESLGMHTYKSISKHRISYALENVHFEFDKYTGEYSSIPEFLEIEANDEETIYKFAAMLGFKREDCKPWGGDDLVNHYKLG